MYYNFLGAGRIRITDFKLHINFLPYLHKIKGNDARSTDKEREWELGLTSFGRKGETLHNNHDK
jgi:hypothetical protein